MRKLLSALTAACLLTLQLLLCCGSAHAETLTPRLTTEITAGAIGSEVTLSLNLTHNPGLCAFAVTIQLPDFFIIQTDDQGQAPFSPTEALSGGNCMAYFNQKTRQLSVVYATDTAGSEERLLGTLPMRIDPEAEAGETMLVETTLNCFEAVTPCTPAVTQTLAYTPGLPPANTLYPASCTAVNDGDTVQFTLLNPYGTVTDWRSSDPALLAIDSTGLATVHGNGTVTLSAFIGEQQFDYPVAVTLPRKLNANRYTLISQQQNVRLSLSPAPTAPITFFADYPEICKVSEDGVLYPQRNGTCIISAACEDIYYRCTVTVKLPYALSCTDYAAKAVGEQFTLEFTPALPDNTKPTWVSGDQSVAEVSSDGVVTFTGNGSTTVSVQINENTYSCQVTLLPYLLGDTNGDGSVHADDAQLALNQYTRMLAQLPDYLNAWQQLAGDVDLDGTVGLTDAAAILDYAVRTLAQMSPTWEDVLSKKS